MGVYKLALHILRGICTKNINCFEEPESLKHHNKAEKTL